MGVDEEIAAAQQGRGVGFGDLAEDDDAYTKDRFAGPWARSHQGKRWRTTVSSSQQSGPRSLQASTFSMLPSRRGTRRTR